MRRSAFEEAQKWLELSRLQPWDPVMQLQNVLALAIVRARMGDEPFARRTLDDAIRQMPAGGMRDVTYGWDWMEILILLREAEALLAAAAASEQP